VLTLATHPAAWMSVDLPLRRELGYLWGRLRCPGKFCSTRFHAMYSHTKAKLLCFKSCPAPTGLGSSASLYHHHRYRNKWKCLPHKHSCVEVRGLKTATPISMVSFWGAPSPSHPLGQQRFIRAGYLGVCGSRTMPGPLCQSQRGLLSSQSCLSMAGS
jgi:hypothetical protein